MTISIMLILGASSLLNSIYSKFLYTSIYWISFILFVLTIIYMIIVKVLLIRVLINENIVYTVTKCHERSDGESLVALIFLSYR